MYSNLMFENYKESLFDNKIILKSQQRFRSDDHRVYIEEVNKITLSSNDDKRIQTFDKVTTYPYGTNIFKICENEMSLKTKFGDGLNNKSKALRSKSEVLRNEAQITRNELQVLRNKSQELRNKSQELRNEAQALRNEAQSPKNKSWIVRSKNKSQVLKNEAQIPREKLFEHNEDKNKDIDKTIPKTKDIDKTIPKTKIKKRINNKMNLINEINKRLAKAKTTLTNKAEPVYKAMSKLQDDSWLRLVELSKIDAILDDAINVVWCVIYGKKISKRNNIDKHKNIKYVSKLTDIIKYKIRQTKIISIK